MQTRGQRIDRHDPAYVQHAVFLIRLKMLQLRMHELQAGTGLEPPIQDHVLIHLELLMQIRLVKPQAVDHAGGVAESGLRERASLGQPLEAFG